MRRCFIPLLAFSLAAGAFPAAAQVAATNLNPLPEIPITVTNLDERLSLILRHYLRTTNSPTNAANAAKATKSAAPAEPGTIPPAAPVKESPAVQWMDAVSAAQAGTRHVLRDGDLIEVKVYQEEDLSARVRLDQTGEVTLPLLGTMRLSGKTIEEARQHVQARLAEDYLVDPQVLITLVEYAKRRFSVMGQVQQPGFYVIPENEKLNLLQAISMAGGFTRLANPKGVVIKRVVNGAESVLRVDVQAMAREKNARLLEIQAEDAIIVNQRVF